jgi:hypothetical protein
MNEVARVLQVPSSVPLLARRREEAEAKWGSGSQGGLHPDPSTSLARGAARNPNFRSELRHARSPQAGIYGQQAPDGFPPAEVPARGLHPSCPRASSLAASVVHLRDACQRVIRHGVAAVTSVTITPATPWPPRLGSIGSQNLGQEWYTTPHAERGARTHPRRHPLAAI